MKKTLIISTLVVVVAIIALVIVNRLTKKDDLSLLYAEVKAGQFELIVSTTGELQAENSTEIRGPEGLGGRNMRFRDITIQDLIPEGTIVRKGDYVATLDRSDADNSFKDELDRLEEYETSHNIKKLDTTITLGDLRDDLLNLKFNMEEAEITLEQSKYEPPTTIRQNRINLDKASRAFDQAQKNYVLKVEQARADVRESEIDLNKQRQKVKDMEVLLTQFKVMAPAPGMVIYKREWSGAKRKVGSNISPFDPVVATLPDLSSMISKTYVNEIDISKVKANQVVRISVDAFPEMSYSGKVISVANIGEQLPNTDAKVFEVIIKMDEVDDILRPSMTTGNQIVTSIYTDVMYIPLECVHATEDSIPFVYTRSKERQIVMLGAANENQVIIEQGVRTGDLLYLSTPEDPETFKLAGEDLILVIKERLRQKNEETDRQRRENEMNRNNQQERQMSPEMLERFNNMSEEERKAMEERMRSGGGQRRDSSQQGGGEPDQQKEASSGTVTRNE
ncbi:MAG TPA: HlyD family efflux transporter periplasmic adaptor subunit [Bacteroidales bacterium]|nr:HlyD family efflux transporter periplasmic adaptor subunit [Bacteroidales bacterium]